MNLNVEFAETGRREACPFVMEKQQVTLLLDEDRLAAMPARHDVVNHALIGESQGSGHARWLTAVTFQSS